MMATEFHATYVPEYAREYAIQKSEQGLKLTKNDVLPIAAGQMRWENEQLKSAKELLICDTDLLQTKVYSEQYYDGFCPPELAHYALVNQYDCYFLCYIDTTWEADGIRDRPDQRQQQFEAFKNALAASQKPYLLLRGTVDEKLEICRKKINELLKSNT